jgi:hypothetical protein
MNENDNTRDDDLRELFADATAGVRPAGSFEDVLTRVRKDEASARRWFLPAVAAAAVAGLIVGAVVWTQHDDSSPSGPTGPAQTAGPTATANPGPMTRTVPVYYAGETPSGPRLFAEQTTLTELDGNLSGLAVQAVKDAVSGKPLDPDYRTLWPAGTTVTGMGGCLDEDGSCTIQVDFRGLSVQNRPRGMSEQAARLAIEQVIRTAQAAMGNHDPVFFTGYTSAGGTQRLDRVLGVDTTGTLSPLADVDALAPVQITSLANDAVVPPGDAAVSGVASAFEANVVWELVVGGDTVVKNGHATAAECCTLSPYSFTIHGLQPGTYTLVVHDEDMSGTGRPVNQDTKEIVVH